MTPYYSQDGITIYHGKAEDVLPAIPAGIADLVFTSPPYNLGELARGSGGFADVKKYPHAKPGKWSGGELAYGYGGHDDAMPYPQYVEWQQSTLRECWRLLNDRGAIYYNHKPRVQEGRLRTPLDLNPGLPVRQVVIWARAGGINFTPSAYCPTHEWIVIFAKPDFRLKSKGASGVGDVWTVAQESNNPHPAPFPLALPARAIETTAPRMVVDPFAGSGTTLEAAKLAGCQAIGIEREERWCEYAAKRLSQGVLFGGDSAKTA